MSFFLKAGAAAAGMALALSLSQSAVAADLGDVGGRGSIKDYTPTMAASPVGPCYFRADTGYSISGDPHLNWNAVYGGVINSQVTNTSMDNGWLVDAGIGCGSGSRGLRGDITFGYHGDRDISGRTGTYGVGNPAVPTVATISSSVSTYTGMFNLYYDIGRFGAIVPYVGAGVGLAYNRTADYVLNPSSVPYAVHGANDLALAWSLSTGFGYQISDRAILDFGYRYIDFGTASTARNDNYGQAQVTRLVANDLNAHEFKIGMRYHFGGASNCCVEAPLK